EAGGSNGASRHGDGVLGSGQGEGAGSPGEGHHPPGDRGAGLRHGGPHRRGRLPGAPLRGDPLHPDGRHPRAARGHRRRCGKEQGHRRGSGPGRRHAWGEADHVLRHTRARRAGRRGPYAEPRLPHLREHGGLRGRDPRLCPAAPGERVQVRSGRVQGGPGREDEDGDPQLPRQPHRRRVHRRRHKGHRRDPAREARRGRSLGRDLRPPPLLGLLCQHRLREGLRPGRADHHPRRLLEDVRDDGLAPRLRRHARSPGRAGDKAAGQLQLLHGRRHPARRPRGALGTAGRRRPDARGVPGQAGPDRGRPQRPAGRRVHKPPGRLLRLPEGLGHRPPRRRARRPAPRRGRGRLPLWHGLRPPRRGPPPPLLRELQGEHLPRPRPHARSALPNRPL
ncbi:MAG: Aminotransferase, class I and II, partial [uncultured Rubrobacteraceae bacterium]